MASPHRRTAVTNSHKAILIAGLSAVLAAGVAGASDGPQRYAVVVGVGDYADPGIGRLKHAEPDARRVYQTLIDPDVGGFAEGNVALLLGKQATAGQIKAVLHRLRDVGKGDLVVVYFAGYRVQEGGQAYWLAHDARKAALATTAMSDADLRKCLQDVPAQNVVALLDCCPLGGAAGKGLADPARAFGGPVGKACVAIAGSADGPEAIAHADGESGVLGHFLVEGLRGAADANADAFVTFAELWDYLGARVRAASTKRVGLHEPVLLAEDGATPQALLALNPKVVAALQEAAGSLSRLFTEARITGPQFDLGRRILGAPALDAVAEARHEVFRDLVTGKLDPKDLARAAADAQAAADRLTAPPTQPAGKATLAVVPFQAVGDWADDDAGRMLAEHLLLAFADDCAVMGYGQLQHLAAQDGLSLAELAGMVRRPTVQGLAKAQRLRTARYLVAGTVTRTADGRLDVTACLNDWQTGGIRASRTAQIAARDWQALVGHLPSLAERLMAPQAPASPASLPAGPAAIASVDPEFLERLVKFWAHDRAATPQDEQRYRQTLSKITDMPWDQALLSAINLPAFGARGSALELLRGRLAPGRLKEMIAAAQPQTDAMAALAMFAKWMDYVPANGSEFLSAVLAFKAERYMIADAARCKAKWAADAKYEFNIRDFHLLTRLSRDPLQEDLGMGELVLGLQKALASRPHVPAPAAAVGPGAGDRLEQQVGKLRMGDLWNLWLLNAMLASERTRAALAVVADRDRKDATSAWGGLIFYANGRAEPKLYTPADAAPDTANDQTYSPSPLLVRDGRDALCRFTCHFDKPDNAPRAGPTPLDLSRAAEGNYYGLVLTSISETSFSAHYYNPAGVVVSLGVFPFRK